MLSKNKNNFDQILKPLVDVLKPIDPTLLTLLGSIPPLLFFILLANGYFWLAIIVFPLFLLDTLDGAVARATGKVSVFGAFLDSTIDRISDFFLISAFAFAGLVRWELAVALLLFSFLVSYARSRGELASKAQISFAIGIMERTERTIGILLALLFVLFFPDINILSYNIAESMFIILIILTFITFTQRLIFARKHL